MGRMKKADKLINDAYLANVQANYLNYCFHVHNPDYVNNPNASEADLKWYPSKFHKHLCNTVQEFMERKTNKAYEILIISTPPQVGKSTTLTETLPSWFLLRNPDKSVIEVSYGDDLAERFGKRNLEKVKQFGDIFGVCVDPKKATSRDFLIKDRKGRMISKGIGSGLTGHSGHLILIDDPIKNRGEADSQRRRDAIWDEFNDSILSRTQAGSKIVVIMTRWHEDDLVGRILENMPEKATYINYECECESTDDPLGRRTLAENIARAEAKGLDTEDIIGDPLCPEIGKGEVWLREFKKSQISEAGLRTWSALYQGHPTVQEGNLLKKEWWQYYEPTELDKMRFDQVIMSVDAAFKDGEKNDFVAISVWGKREQRIYMLKMINEHLNLTGTIRKIRLMKAKYPSISAILIEDAANGTAIIEMMRDNTSGIIPVKPEGSKESRVNAASLIIEAGNVYLPQGDPIAHKFIEQCAKFPNDKHDDMVDSMTQAVIRLSKSRIGRMRRAIEDKTGWKLPDNRPKRVDIGGKIRAI